MAPESPRSGLSPDPGDWPITISRDPRATWRTLHIDRHSLAHRRASLTSGHAPRPHHAGRSLSWADPLLSCVHSVRGEVRFRPLSRDPHSGWTRTGREPITPRRQSARRRCSRLICRHIGVCAHNHYATTQFARRKRKVALSLPPIHHWHLPMLVNSAFWTL